MFYVDPFQNFAASGVKVDGASVFVYGLQSYIVFHDLDVVRVIQSFGILPAEELVSRFLRYRKIGELIPFRDGHRADLIAAVRVKGDVEGKRSGDAHLSHMGPVIVVKGVFLEYDDLAVLSEVAEFYEIVLYVARVYAYGFILDLEFPVVLILFLKFGHRSAVLGHVPDGTVEHIAVIFRSFEDRVVKETAVISDPFAFQVIQQFLLFVSTAGRKRRQNENDKDQCKNSFHVSDLLMPITCPAGTGQVYLLNRFDYFTMLQATARTLR